jgi:hypothetical protein
LFIIVSEGGRGLPVQDTIQGILGALPPQCALILPRPSIWENS